MYLPPQSPQAPVTPARPVPSSLLCIPLRCPGKWTWIIFCCSLLTTWNSPCFLFVGWFVFYQGLELAPTGGLCGRCMRRSRVGVGAPRVTGSWAGLWWSRHSGLTGASVVSFSASPGSRESRARGGGPAPALAQALCPLISRPRWGVTDTHAARGPPVSYGRPLGTCPSPPPLGVTLTERELLAMWLPAVLP